MIKFSVIMPTFNRGFCIDNAITCLLNQSYEDFELVIIDDGSTDNKEDLIKQKYQNELNLGKIVYYKILNNAGVCVGYKDNLLKRMHIHECFVAHFRR